MAVAITRTEMSVRAPRAVASKVKASKAARRMLALALVLEGAARKTAAETCGMDWQTLRYRVHRYNTEGLEGLSNRRSAGAAPRLNPIENVWAYLRANRLAISVFETCDQIVTRCCEAWNVFVNDTATVRSTTSRDYAKAVRS